MSDACQLVKCGRCQVELCPVGAETCWWCLGPLCVDCWDEHGHCGHPEADAANERARQRVRVYE